MNYTLAEFFCGCGGFSRGFTNTGRFIPVLGNDIKEEALATYKFNHAILGNEPIIFNEDIRNLSLETIGNALKSRGIKIGELDCLIGGPPCQGFSQMRRSQEKEGNKVVKFKGFSKLAEDPRNDLVIRFLEIAEYVQPKFVIIENVPQMLSHGFEGRLGRLAEIVIGTLEDLGYSVEVDVLTAADFGVPQIRERAFFVASSVGKASFPLPTHANPASIDSSASTLLPWRTVKDAISDLPEPSLDVEVLGGKGLENYKSEISEFISLMRNSKYFPYNHITRKYKESVLSIIREMRPGKTWDTESHRMQVKYKRLAQKFAQEKNIDEKEALHILLSKEEINQVFFKKYYWSAYSRLSWGEPALTITANSNFLGSGRFTHPVAMRGITMREAARLQSFDDDFRFITSSDDISDTARIGVGMDMIGEAVPPLLSQAIASHIASLLDKYNNKYAQSEDQTLDR